jgi:hypothetical protein
LPTNGVGNITNAPLFVETNGWANLRLQPTSSCINAGNNAYVVGGSDLDGNPRNIGDAVDMGAYEFQAAVHYVDSKNSNPTPPYTSWATAAVGIQEALDAAAPGDGILVTNGSYSVGNRTVDGITPNRVAVSKGLSLGSINGPQWTTIDGGGLRCVYLADRARLSGFTLTNGSAPFGGGVWCESTNAVVSDCVLSGSSAWCGGGAFGGTLLR